MRSRSSSSEIAFAWATLKVITPTDLGLCVQVRDDAFGDDARLGPVGCRSAAFVDAVWHVDEPDAFAGGWDRQLGKVRSGRS